MEQYFASYALASRRWKSRGLQALALAILASASMTAPCQIKFTDVTTGAGMGYVGESYGAAWGDVNGDGLPDLFVSHHRSAPSLYVNRSNGRFEDRHAEVDIWQKFPFSDEHGAAWGDFDRDGDQDLMVSLGSKDPTQFLVNDGGFLGNHINDFSIDPTPHWQGRMPVWFDFNRDGLLDFAMATSNGIFQLFAQSGGNFIKQNSAAGNGCSNNPYGQLADLDFDGQPEWICAAQASFPARIYSYATLPFTDLTALIPFTNNTVDSVFADFDGDLRDDALLVTGKVRVSDAKRVSTRSVQAHIISDNSAERGFTFKTAGDITLRLFWSARNISNVRIGASGFTPSTSAATGPITFTLSPSNPNVVGIYPHTSGDPTSIYVGYDPSTSTWKVINASGNAVAGAEGAWSYLYAYVDSTTTVDVVTPFGLTPGDLPSAPVLFTNPTGSQYVNSTAAAHLNVPISCVSVAAADFDNDMDIDLFFVCRNGVNNAADILYQNLGHGVFAAVPAAGGAAGPQGFNAGLGENVALADFDMDGFVDIFETNGLALYPENPFSNGGPDKLYRNAGNANHWVELDLIGTTSNRDAVGAQVTATAGGVMQRRMQNGGYHRWAQNLSRIHFGLAGNALVDLHVVWPSGRQDLFKSVAANHVYRVTEAGGIQVLPAPGDPGPSPCGTPTYNKATEAGVFIWKNCSTTGAWSMRVSPGNQSFTAGGSVSASVPFASVTPFSIEAKDVLDVSNPARIGYTLAVSTTGQDGFDFSFPTDAQVCFAPTGPASLPVYVGSARTVKSGAFSLPALKSCSAAP